MWAWGQGNLNYWEDPKIQCPAASMQRRGRGLNSHLGPGWAEELGRHGKGSCFHFPGWTSEVGLGKAVLKGHFLFPTVWSCHSHNLRPISPLPFTR